MAIIVEDGTIVPNANSYASAANLVAYAADRGISLTSTPDVLMIKAMDYIESQYYKGKRATATQALQWPRILVNIDGYSVPDDVIPINLINAQCATALSIDAGIDPLAPTTQAVKREKVEGLEVEYQDNTTSQSYSRTISAALNKLLSGGGGFSVVRV